MSQQPFDFSRLEETVSVVPHNPEWIAWYRAEVKALEPALSALHPEFAHIGSSAVAGLTSKPIVDIMIGVHSLELPRATQVALTTLGYEYFGRLHPDQERLFARKRGAKAFNLQIVPIRGKEWHEKIAFRDYLNTHPEEVALYSQIKADAMAAGKTTLLDYHRYKDAVVSGILGRALGWASHNP